MSSAPSPSSSTGRLARLGSSIEQSILEAKLALVQVKETLLSVRSFGELQAHLHEAGAVRELSSYLADSPLAAVSPAEAGSYASHVDEELRGSGNEGGAQDNRLANFKRSFLLSLGSIDERLEAIVANVHSALLRFQAPESSKKDIDGAKKFVIAAAKLVKKIREILTLDSSAAKAAKAAAGGAGAGDEAGGASPGLQGDAAGQPMSPRSPVVLDETDTSYIPLEELEFEKAIGEGAFGKVYKGTWRGEESAIKSMRLKDDKMRAQITREIGVLRELTHYAIVHFKGISKRDDELLLVMELVKGGELYDMIIDKDVTMSWATKITMSADIAGALAYLHSKSIMHRDIKSENILCDADFHVKLCDFGFARIAQQASRMSLCGSFYFNAPELLLGNPYNEKVDVYSFGIVVCELLTRGKVDLTRTADSKYSLDVKLMRQSIPDDCPPNLWKVAFSCCNFNPEERPPAAKVAEFLLTIKKAHLRAEKKSKGSKAKELSTSTEGRD